MRGNTASDTLATYRRPGRRWPARLTEASRRWFGPVLTIAALAVILAIRPQVPVPNPSAILLMAIAVSAVLGGILPAMLSAGVLIAFLVVDASVPGQLFRYEPDQLNRLLIIVITAPGMALVVGGIQQTLERERSRKASRDYDERERALTETAADAIIQIDAGSVIRAANPAAASMFGHPPGSLTGQSMTVLMPEAFRARHRAAIGRYMTTGERTIPWNGIELTGLHASGREFPVEVSFGDFGEGAGRRFTGIIRDITHRKELEAQLLQAQKMEAIGQLAGGVAHDFNNMLTVISGYSSMLEEDLRGTPQGNSVEAIQTAADQATALTRQLLAFSRRQELRPSATDLSAVVARVERLLRRLIGEDIELVVRAQPGLPAVMADAVQMETILVNLATNARDAMPAGGTLTIETARVELDNAYARDHVEVEPGPYVLLAVSDTGQGMAPEVASRIFEPFFTTKEIGRGTGLGLATVYGVVRQSGGHIWVYSEPDRGSTFKVYLPEALGEAAAPVPTPARPGTSRRTGHILVAEDEASVRALVVSVLERAGYLVTVADDGSAAERLVDDPSLVFDAVVTDVVLPGRSGPQIAERIEELRPGVPILFISGYTASALEPRGLRSRPLLEKPFTPSQLEDAVARLFGARKPE